MAKKKGKSEKKKGWLGRSYIQHYDAKNNKSGKSEIKKTIFGKKYTQHYDAKDNKTGKSERKQNWLGEKYTQKYNSHGEKSGTSAKRTTWFGKVYTQHYDSNGNKTDWTEHKKSWFGKRYVERYGNNESLASQERNKTYVAVGDSFSDSRTYDRSADTRSRGMYHAVIGACIIIGIVLAYQAFNLLRSPRSDIPAGGVLPSSLKFDLTAVWNPPDIVWQRMQSECRITQGANALTTCVSDIMQKANASPQAVAFMRLLGGEAFMTKFRQIGPLGIVTAFHPFRANDNDAIYIVNGIPSLIDPNESSSQIDIREDPLYPVLVRRYPQLMLWGHADFQRARTTAIGQELIFSMALLNGCHSCEVGGTASIALEFDSSGHLHGTKLLGLTPSPQVNEQTSLQTNNNRRVIPGLPLIADLDGILPQFSGDGRLVATTVERVKGTQETHIWLADTGQPLTSFTGTCEGLSQDGELVALRVTDDSLNQSLELRNTLTGQLVLSWKESFSGFSPDGKSVRSWTWINQQSVTRIRDIVTGEVITTIPGSQAMQVDSNFLVTQTGDLPRTSVWNLKNNQLASSFAENFVAISSDGRLIATKSKASLNVWDIQTGHRVATIESWGSAWFVPGGQFIITEVYDDKLNRKEKTTKMWTIKTGRFVRVIPGEVSSGSVLEKLVATTLRNGSEPDITKILEASSGEEIGVVTGAFRAFSTDGMLLMTAPNAMNTSIWASHGGNKIADLPGYAVGFSPDGTRALTGDESTVHLWRIR